MTQKLNEFKEAVKKNPALIEAIKKSTLQGIVALAKSMDFDITAEQFEEAVKIKGNTGASDAVVLWENYVVVG